MLLLECHRAACWGLSFSTGLSIVSSFVSSHTAWFADDKVLFRQIDSAEDEEQKQKDLDVFVDLKGKPVTIIKLNQMKLNQMRLQS